MKKEIKIPEIAENVETGIIAEVLVSKGDTIDKDQPVVEIETDKATTEIPSPYSGKIIDILVSSGDEVNVGQTIITVESEEKGEGADDDSKEQEDDQKKDEEQDQKEEKEDKGEEKPDDDVVENDDEKQSKEKEERKGENIPAAPSVRRLAREKNIDLSEIKGSGPGGRIVKEDIENTEKRSTKEKTDSEHKKAEANNFSKWGPTHAEKMDQIRYITARNVTDSWQNIPHVTQFDEADMTQLEAFRQAMKAGVEKNGAKLTVTALLLKIAGFALQRFPRFNASADMENKVIVYKDYVNIGVAVDTPSGLLVPVIRDVNRKSLSDLSLELNNLAEKARDKKLEPDEMQGGNFTVSNLGGIGGTAFSPIILPPQVAILGVSRTVNKPVFMGDEIEKRAILPLSLSYDHRVIDGADGARFLKWICDVIENPYALMQ